MQVNIETAACLGHTMKTYGKQCRASYTFNFFIRLRTVENFTPRSAYAEGNFPHFLFCLRLGGAQETAWTHGKKQPYGGLQNVL